MQERLEILQGKIDELNTWFEQNQQFTFPIGLITRKLVNKDVLVSTNKTTSTTFDISLEVIINDKLYWISAKKV